MYLQCFCTFKKTWQARNTVNSGVLATCGRWNAGIYTVVCPWRYQTPVNYNIFCTFWTDFLSHFGGLKLWYLRGFLPSDNAKCCKLQHFVRCLRSIFKPAMLSHVLCILPQETMLQIETGRQRDPKESWREETHRSFHTQGLLHREVFTLHAEGFTQRSLYSKELLHTSAQELSHTDFLHEEVFTIYTEGFLRTDAFAHRSFYTEKPLHRGAFTHKSVYTQQAFTHTGAFTQRSLYAEEVVTHRRFYTEKSLL